MSAGDIDPHVAWCRTVTHLLPEDEAKNGCDEHPHATAAAMVSDHNLMVEAINLKVFGRFLVDRNPVSTDGRKAGLVSGCNLADGISPAFITAGLNFSADYKH